jgi:formylglycine-generating enzyme required for sulfatase activity
MNTILLAIIALSLSASMHSGTGEGEKSGFSSGRIQPGLVLITGGEFIMGSVSGPANKYIDNAAHRVQVDSFYIEKYEVTNAQYLEFCESTGHPLPEFWGMDEFYSGPGFPDHPVVGVTWVSAMNYAEWKGMRLPTEAEWEYAARGGLANKRYPYGNDVDSSLCNYNGTFGHPIPVGSLPANGYGLFDMSGNVVEWVNDYYAKDYYNESPIKNPAGPEYGKRRVIRGGGWRSGKMCATVSFRQSLRPYWVDFNVGFRCAKDL